MTRAAALLTAAGLRLERTDGRPVTESDYRRAYGVLAATLERPMYTHQIQTSDGRSINGTHYTSREEAVAAIAEHYDWTDPAVSPSYNATPPDDPSGCDATSAVSVYATQAERDADEEGAYAPRVVELLHPLEDVER